MRNAIKRKSVTTFYFDNRKKDQEKKSVLFSTKYLNEAFSWSVLLVYTVHTFLAKQPVRRRSEEAGPRKRSLFLVKVVQLKLTFSQHFNPNPQKTVGIELAYFSEIWHPLVAAAIMTGTMEKVYFNIPTTPIYRLTSRRFEIRSK